jgi:high-affinity K+ transport system ATPase subunit B
MATPPITEIRARGHTRGAGLLRRAEVLPADKVDVVKQLRADGKVVAMVALAARHRAALPRHTIVPMLLSGAELRERGRGTPALLRCRR